MSTVHEESRLRVPRVAIKAIRDMEDQRGPQSAINVGNAERWASGIGGALLLTHGLRRGNFGGLALAILGGGLLYRGFSGHCQAYQALNIDTAGKHRSDEEEGVWDGRLVKHSMTINRPAAEIFAFLKVPANHVRFGENVESVRADEQGVWHWAMKGPFGATWQFQSQIINQEPGKLLAWKSLPGGDLNNAGAFRLVPAGEGRGTEVTLEMNYEPPAGALGVAVAKVLGQDPDAMVRENLRHLKQLLETGEIPTIQGQPSGRA